MKRKMVILLMSLLVGMGEIFSQQNSIFTGIVMDQEDQELIGATVYLEELGIGDDTDRSGEFRIANVPGGTHAVVVSYVGYKPVVKEVGFQQGVITEDTFRLEREEQILLEVEVFGHRRERPEKMDALTRIHSASMNRCRASR